MTSTVEQLRELDVDVLLQSAEYLNHLGGGPMEDRLRLLHSQLSALPTLLTALAAAEKREKELAEENALNYELRCKHFAALSTERERVIEEVAKAISDIRAKAPRVPVFEAYFDVLRECELAIRALRSPEVAKENSHE